MANNDDSKLFARSALNSGNKGVLLQIWLVTAGLALLLPWAYGVAAVLLATCLHFAVTER